MTSVYNTDDDDEEDHAMALDHLPTMTPAAKGQHDHPLDLAVDSTADHDPEDDVMQDVIEADDPCEEEEEDDDDTDLQSIYTHTHAAAAAQNYPPVARTYRTETPYLTTESLAGNSDLAASTRSLWAQDLDYREIHDRLYCREWFMPIDEIEQLRLSLNHQVFLHVLHGEHTTVKLDNPQHILDVGTGTGEWAIKMAETFPDCEVVGTDIAAVAETSSVPMNVFFEIEDAEEWDRSPDLYDLIHLRTMMGAFRDWRYIYECAYYSLKPGGWIELQDFDATESEMRFAQQFSPDSAIHRLFEDLEIAADRSGRRRGPAYLDPHLFMDAGFVDVRVTEYQIPISVAEKSAGKIWLISCLDSLEAGCLRLLTEQMGWDPDECKIACESVAREMAELAKDPAKSEGLVVKAVVIVARKPEDAPESTGPPPQMRDRSRSASLSTGS
ncbi:Methyltransferase domain [Geosmithia morbida]|uniref:Methyltransferase domain n=1 Tax=Geosmithia morbida TaxID=1094350 RepID=A0A9P4YWT2_9HYPO|nr:Methyltransferase domain [Geosmithia morbida]KAF4123219.1 Methyltransferase domain [Geosmithia morbida]